MENEDVERKGEISKVESLLEEYTEEKLLLKKVKLPEDARIDMTTDQLARMDIDQINDWRFEMAQYLLYLQKEINKHKSRSNWAAGALRTYISKKAVDCDGFLFEQKKANAMKNDNYAEKLDKLALKSQAALDRLEFLPNKIISLMDIAKDMSWARRNAEKNNGQD